MDDQIVPYIKDARVGSRVWIAPQAWRIPQTWSLATVTKVARKYFTVGDGFGARDFKIGTGQPRPINGFTGGSKAMGDREKWVLQNKYGLIEKLREEDRYDVLKAVSDLFLNTTGES